MRVVIDTNIFVSSFFGGNPKTIIDLWRNGSLTLCFSKGIIDEYVRVLARMGLEKARELEEILALFARGFNSVFTAKTPQLHIIKRDPDDNKFLECAVALEAQFIISGDKDITDILSYMRIQCVTPNEFLKKFKEIEGENNL
ncbi:putative toxin-antitoxin system toxin component, PIN family [candidate division CSSED10-310 bacterium]|uniref:Toxin-antitoxin system toxin component, PIN family n=1 Tax=candidate division CSSED10-310 bacterium TaxID=2855610 RepID=A0ABV6YTF4_UNCC1